MIAIIGAGPVGSYLAYLLAKKGFDVSLFEEHKKIGEPIQCTGLVTKQIKNLIKLDDEFVVNKIKNVRVYNNGDKTEFTLKGEDIVVDRTKFDTYIAEMAVNSGARIYTGYRYDSFVNNDIIFSNGKRIKADVLIGADGPYSSVARSNGLFVKRKYFVAPQARVKGKFDSEYFDVYLGVKDFGWSVPENNEISRIGLVARDVDNVYFNNFLKGKGEVLGYQSGVVPVYDSKAKISNKNVFLVGDAAGHVKVSTHGGIVLGMMAAQELTKTIENGGSYENRVRKRIGKDLDLALFVRKTLDKFSKEDYDKLFELCKGKRVKNILESYDRDFLSKFFWKLLLIEPRFLKFFWRVIH